MKRKRCPFCDSRIFYCKAPRLGSRFGVMICKNCDYEIIAPDFKFWQKRTSFYHGRHKKLFYDMQAYIKTKAKNDPIAKLLDNEMDQLSDIEVNEYIGDDING